MKSIGKGVPLMDVDFPNLWCALDYFASTIEELQGSIHSQDEKSRPLNVACEILQTQMSSLTSTGESAETKAALPFWKLRVLNMESDLIPLNHC